MKGCELCRNGARIYCEADGASLCWDCDDKVHSANFLVAKHSRTLLCNVCHSPTPWQASGIKLGPTLSLCHICLHNYTLTKQQHKEGEEAQNDHDTTQLTNDDGFEQGTSTSTDHDYSGEEDDDDDDDEKDEDNQVVPWFSSPPTSPPVATSSTTEDSSSVSISATATAGRGVIFTETIKRKFRFRF